MMAWSGASGAAWRWARLAVAAVVALLALIGGAFTIGDLGLGVSASTPAVLIALGLGFLAASPLFFGGRRGVRRLLAAVAIYAAFAAWIVTLRRVDWDERKPFLRAFQQIHVGMTRSEVEALMRTEFLGRKAPTSGWDASHERYTLDPDDARYDSEIVFIRISEGRVVSADYLPD